MQGIGSVPATHATVDTPVARAMPVQAVGSLSILSAALCVGAFALLLATAISDYLIRIATVETADWPHFLGQFAIPAMPLGVVALLLLTRSHVSATLVGAAGTLFYLAAWLTLAF